MTRIAGFLGDAVVLLLIIFLFPLIILVIGMPMVLFVRLLLEMMARL